ncbi:3',5'-cyclic-AMP phosphodiesterase [Anthocerotibacter panamensis]|uniref:3',5'-cyclic-AMP phosphodiesterase n=1 Tax=Anthocerotibacter panamensis TaxID=2857077 RepID=UPI001C408B7E|nr:3',5'-cyclic-AMP phosphodiesterase [Anthocerotibacter panamensis]
MAIVAPPPPKDLWRVVQLTDLHLFATTEQKLLGLNTAQSFHAVLEEMRLHHWPADVLLATGDLAQDGSRGAYQTLAQALFSLQTPTYWIPGNHDDPQAMREILAGSPIFVQRQVLLPPWQIILLDSTLPDQVGGYLASEQLSLLEFCLTQHPDFYTLVCLHHHPLSLGCDWMENIGLKNGPEFLRVVQAYPQVRGVLWGHVHQQFEQQQGNALLMSTPSTCIQFKPKTQEFSLDTQLPGYRWLELYSNGTLQTGVQRIAHLGVGQQIHMDSVGY